jgi:hypothetical protein
VRHKPDALEKVNGASRLTEEDVSATTHLGSLEVDRAATVFQDAVDEGAIDEALVVDLKGFVLDGAAIDDFHCDAPEARHFRGLMQTPPSAPDFIVNRKTFARSVRTTNESLKLHGRIAFRVESEIHASLSGLVDEQDIQP